VTRSPWAREYARTPAVYLWGRAPSAFARDLPVPAPGARVLDLGAGEGRDSVFFAARGCVVTAIEVSRAGIEKGRRLAREAGVRVRWLCGDMGRLRPAGPFDLVFSCGSLHYVPRPARERLLRRLRAITAPGGRHAHVVFTDRDVYVEKGEAIDYFEPGELIAAYRGWRVVARRLGTIRCAADGIPHRHGAEWLVAARGASAVRAGPAWPARRSAGTLGPGLTRWGAPR